MENEGLQEAIELFEQLAPENKEKIIELIKEILSDENSSDEQ